MRLPIALAMALALAACEAPPPGPSTGSMDAPPAAGGSFLQEVNAFRAGNGLAAFRADPALDAAAQAHAEDMATRGYFSHTGADGSSPGARARRAGCGWGATAENIAYGQSGPAEAVAWWAGSAGHRANLLNPSYARLGTGRAGDIYVTLFADRC